MSGSPALSVTQLLRSWRNGDDGARDRLLPRVYQELRRLARRELGRERAWHTLESRELVHETYVRLIDTEVPWRDRVHFYAIAARIMRQVLIDHARTKNSLKRGAGIAPLSLDDTYPVDGQVPAFAAGSNHFDVLMIDEALTRLGAADRRMERLVEMHFFGGMTYDEMAAAAGISTSTVHRDLYFAKAWLRRYLSESG